MAGTPSRLIHASSSFQVLPLWNFIGMPASLPIRSMTPFAQLLDLAL